MAKVKCPKCRRTAAESDINVAADVVLCRSCGEAFKLSATVGLPAHDNFDVSTPPRGAWFDQRHNGFSVGATTRSWGALFVVPFTAVWAGGSLTGIYGTQLAKGAIDLEMAFFGLPFLIGSIILISLSAMMVAGKVTVTVENDRGTIFTGLGPVGWTRRFLWSDMVSIEEGISRVRWHGPGLGNNVIIMQGRTRVAFGMMLSSERQYFVLQALRQMRFSR